MIIEICDFILNIVFKTANFILNTLAITWLAAFLYAVLIGGGE